MPHEGLQRPCIDSTSRQGVAGGMPQHVGMNREGQISGHAKPFYKLLSTVDGQRCLALRQEHMIRMRMLAAQSPQ
jgi:hypothetical protein